MPIVRVLRDGKGPDQGERGSQLNPAGEKEDGAGGAAGVPTGAGCTGSTVTEPLLLWRGLCGPGG